MIEIERLRTTPVEEQKVEMVERKGLGHPDFIADSIAEAFSRALCREYIKEYGVIVHHNVDKLDVVGGKTCPRFGGGKVEKPILIFFSGRATKVGRGVEEVAIEAAKEWIKGHLRFLDPEEHVEYLVKTKEGAGNLVDLYKRREIGANDTSIGMGYAPLSSLEKDVLEMERFLNSSRFKKKYPFSGEDVKIMGLRIGNEKKMTVAMSFVDKFVEGERDYFEKKKEVVEILKEKFDGKVYLNTADKEGRGEDGCYLTVTGTSAEMGDDGAVGRGNRINGVISFNRFMSLEAVAGKNPVNHVGKIYNLVAREAAKEIYERMPEAKEVYVKILSQIGKPLDEPQVVSVQVLGDVDKELVEDIVRKWLEKSTRLSEDIIKGKYDLF
ncbi:MAG TPA: methionine adenosyltransferase [Candidatus Aenigmarchaeota archaeon]|nr:methionine adenosyltransferase [Candidatus Aenigmarchaeota archaeon]